jgi:hypothetical protein
MGGDVAGRQDVTFVYYLEAAPAEIDGAVAQLGTESPIH